MAPHSAKLVIVSAGGKRPSAPITASAAVIGTNFGHGHPVEAVHEVHQIDEPQAADDKRGALDPPRQERCDAQLTRQREDHQRHRERLQQ